MSLAMHPLPIDWGGGLHIDIKVPSNVDGCTKKVRGRTGDRTSDFLHATQALFHWATRPLHYLENCSNERSLLGRMPWYDASQGCFSLQKKIK